MKRREIEQKEKELAEYRKMNPEAKKSRHFTISIAIPGSIIGKVQSKELKTYVAGQVILFIKLFEVLFIYILILDWTSSNIILY